MTTATLSNPPWWSGLLERLEPIRRRPVTFILSVIAVLVFVEAALNHRTDPGSADRSSVVVARDLYAGITHAPPQQRKQRQIRPPGYPLLLTAIAYVDPNVARGLECAGKEPDGCVDGFPFLSVVVIQTLAVLLCLLLIYRLAWRLSGSREVAIITLLMAFFWGRFADFAGNLYGHTWYQLGVVASLYLLIPAAGRLSVGRAVLAGIVAAYTTLIEPTFVVFALVGAVLLAFSRSSGGIKAAAALVGGFVAGLAVLLMLAQAAGYDTEGIARHMTWNLAERVAFNRLEGPAWWAAILLPLPVFGPVFGLLFSQEVVDSFGYYTPGTYVFDGTNRILPEALRQPGTAWHQFFWLIRTHIFGDLAGYLHSTVALLVRGIWSGGAVIAVIGIFQISPMLRWARIDARHAAVLQVLVLTVSLLIAGMLFTSNPMYLNPLLIFVFAFAISYIAGGR